MQSFGSAMTLCNKCQDAKVCVFAVCYLSQMKSIVWWDEESICVVPWSHYYHLSLSASFHFYHWFCHYDRCLHPSLSVWGLIAGLPAFASHGRGLHLGAGCQYWKPSDVLRQPTSALLRGLNFVWSKPSITWWHFRWNHIRLNSTL